MKENRPIHDTLHLCRRHTQRKKVLLSTEDRATSLVWMQILSKKQHGVIKIFLLRSLLLRELQLINISPSKAAWPRVYIKCICQRCESPEFSFKAQHNFPLSSKSSRSLKYSSKLFPLILFTTNTRARKQVYRELRVVQFNREARKRRVTKQTRKPIPFGRSHYII